MLRLRDSEEQEELSELEKYNENHIIKVLGCQPDQGFFPVDYLDVDRVIAIETDTEADSESESDDEHYTKVDGVRKTHHALVKWKGLGYDVCTW
jgi:hypothetical protein